MTTPKQEAIKAALRESPGLSNRQIAKRIGGAHHVTVGNVRKALEASGELQRPETVTGGDGKSYKRTAKLKRIDTPQKRCKPHKVKAKKPTASLDEQVSRAMAGLLRTAQKEGHLEELADAFRRYYAAHLVPPRVTPGVDITAVLAAELKRRKGAAAVAAEVVDASEVATTPKVGTEVADPPPARDIQPDADNDDYGELPVEEQIALHEDEAALERPRGEESPIGLASLPSEGQWMVGEVVYINQFTQSGRVCLPDFGDLGFTDRTPRAAGLKLQPGLEVECQFVMRHGHPWVVEFAKAHVVA
jgi:hypothetical protein